MYAQTLSEALTLNEITFLKKQVWWTGCTETPYVCRGGVYNKFSYLLDQLQKGSQAEVMFNLKIVITDTRSVWVTKADQEQIIEEKDKFNQSIKIKFEDILNTLDTPLRFGRSNTQFTKLQFRKNREEDLIFLMEFEVGIYPFKWEFFLTKMDDNEIFNILADDLINPMAKTIISLEKRGNSYKQKCIQIEKELIKRLSEKERNTYKSCIDKDNEEAWSKFLIGDVRGKLNYISQKLQFVGQKFDLSLIPSLPYLFYIINQSQPIIQKDIFNLKSLDDKLTNFDFGPAAQFFLSNHNIKNLNEDQENNKIVVNIQNEQGNNEDLKRMKLIQDYFSTFEDQPISKDFLRPDSKKKIKQEDSNQQQLKAQQLGIKVNYEEQNGYNIKNDQKQIQAANQQKDNKKKKKHLDFL